MTSNTQNALDPEAWASKARALDLYRWLMLRERHGLLGSVLRYSRDVLLDVIFGLRAYFSLPNHAVAAEPCDFLLLQGSPKVIPLQRKKRLIERLRARGYHLVESAHEGPRQIIARQLLARPPQVVPLRYFGYAAYAEWLVQRHDPRLLLNDRNGSFFIPFLRLSLNHRQRLLVHLAHASTVENSRRLGMNDYDFYLLFGKSSEEALAKRALRFGTSTLLLAGSHMIDDSFDLPVATPSLKTVLVLGVGPDKEKEACYLRNYRLVAEWAADHPDRRILIKRHPRSSVPFWAQVSVAQPNVEVLSELCPLAQALEQAAVVINFMSNAVIEAGLARRPAIYVSTCSGRDVLEQERFFGAAVKSVSVLEERIQSIEKDYKQHAQRAENFARFHLAGGVNGLERTVAILEAIFSGVELPVYVARAELTATI